MPGLPTSPRRLAVLPLVAAVGLGVLAAVPPAQALTSVTLTNGAVVQINDARRPSLDTGSIRNVSGSRMEGFGNIFVHVDPAAGAAAPRMNDQMMRGWGLNGSASGAYTPSESVRLGDLSMTRTVQVTASSGTTSFFDTFTNTSTAPLTFDVSFGGSLGYGAAAATSGTISATGSGDTVVDPTDRWVTATTPGNFRPTGVVVGSGVDGLGNQQLDPFTTPYVQSGSQANDLGFIHTLTLQPGETSSLMEYVVVGALSDTTQIATTTAALAATPDFSTLSVDQICTLANWDISAYAAACAGAQPLALPAAEVAAPPTTDQAYDVTGKTIQQLQADLSSGTITSVQLTKAYLDRINAYDGGALGFHAFITVAKDAVAQAMAADKARAAGKTGDLLGVPIAVKDLYDTKDMPTTGGTRALEDWNPGEDAWQVAKLREAGAVIIGKTNLSEFANSGSFSESGFKQTWNALYPSKTSFGSSGGSATAVATSMAAAAMGTQTGVSLYAPSTGAGLSAFRGTDGLTSAAGVMPLTWATDYAGPIAKSITDLASILDATATRTTGNDPADQLTNRVDNSLRPTEWKSGLRTTALQGKVIGYVPSAFVSTQITDDNAGTVALNQARAAIEAAGGTLVPLATGSAVAPTQPAAAGYPTNTGSSANAEGWERYIAEPRPATFPYTTKQLEESPANLPYNVSANYTQVPYDDVSADNVLKRRDAYKVNAASWMDTAFTSKVDAVLYPGFLTSAGNNDAASAIFSSDRASGVITQGIGLPTAILPIGKNADGQSNNVQIVGRAWTDTTVLDMAYALEQQVGARTTTSFAPALKWTGPAASSTSLTLASTETRVGTPTTATVTVAADPAATGTVSVSVAGKSVTGTLAGGTVTVTLPADLPAGTQLVTASYAGSPTVAASSATAMLKVTQGAVSVAVKAKRSHVTRGQKVRLVVTPAAGSPATTVLVYDGKDVVKTATIGATKKTIGVGRLDPGKHVLKLYVVGGPDYAASTSAPVKVRVARR